MVYDVLNMSVEEYESRWKNVFFQNDLFKVRAINLKAGGGIPECHMDSYVMFYVAKGEVVIKKNGEAFNLKENQLFITEPAVLSMQSASGSRLIGVQIKTR